MTITTLIINELKNLLERDPTITELHSLSEYIGNQKIKFLVDLEVAIRNWVESHKK